MRRMKTTVGILLIFLLLTGCSYEKEDMQEIGDKNIPTVTEETKIAEITEITETAEVTETEDIGDTIEEIEEIYTGDPTLPIDYDYLSENHEILEYNICTNPQSVYDNSVLCEYLKSDLEMEEDAQEQFDMVPSTIDYFEFDFNGDGLEDYMVIFSGAIWSGSAGDDIRIYIQQEDGTLERFFSVQARIRTVDDSYRPIAILNEQSGGYYAFVFSWTENRVWRYEEETGQYTTR